mmetsp:Transcript_22960/g.52580  ORF Transcript_22960/g.52580 Transcript_22960/m.52580 type:complete len:172 (-) Transcript_22960:1276-1791(-)
MSQICLKSDPFVPLEQNCSFFLFSLIFLISLIYLILLKLLHLYAWGFLTCGGDGDVYLKNFYVFFLLLELVAETEKGYVLKPSSPEGKSNLFTLLCLLLWCDTNRNTDAKTRVVTTIPTKNPILTGVFNLLHQLCSTLFALIGSPRVVTDGYTSNTSMTVPNAFPGLFFRL